MARLDSVPRPRDPQGEDRLYDRVAASLALIAERQNDQPDLDAMARAAGMSAFHFQRAFTRWVGISPKKFLQYLTLDYAKARLGEADSVLGAALDAGLSGPGRLHDLFVTHEAVTPGAFKRRGEGLTIRWGWHDSPFGDCLLMLTDRGVCGLAFALASDGGEADAGEADAGAAVAASGDGGRAEAFADMAARWPRARFVRDEEATRATARRVFEPAAAGAPPLPLHLCGTNFQIRVWDALLRLPPGALVTYGGLAGALGTPRAARAVGAAVGANPISWIIPCHRAILSNGYLRDYAWGRARKAAMIGWEAGRRTDAAGAA
ncbi:MAG: methylated-DNA--[protein]-cysteine S-methyltransferase [Alphaproteobacteria bacterium]